MTEELKYYKFVEKYVSEWHTPEETEWQGLQIYFIPSGIEDFIDLVGDSYWDDGYGYETTHLCPDGSIIVNQFDNWLSTLDINWEDIFYGNEENFVEQPIS